MSRAFGTKLGIGSGDCYTHLVPSDSLKTNLCDIDCWSFEANA